MIPREAGGNPVSFRLNEAVHQLYTGRLPRHVTLEAGRPVIDPRVGGEVVEEGKVD